MMRRVVIIFVTGLAFLAGVSFRESTRAPRPIVKTSPANTAQVQPQRERHLLLLEDIAAAEQAKETLDSLKKNSEKPKSMNGYANP